MWPINVTGPPRSDVTSELRSLSRGPMSRLSSDLLADVRGLASTQAPQARAVTCFSEEVK